MPRKTCRIFAEEDLLASGCGKSVALGFGMVVAGGDPAVADSHGAELIMATEPLLAVSLLRRLGFPPWQYGLAFPPAASADSSAHASPAVSWHDTANTAGQGNFVFSWDYYRPPPWSGPAPVLERQSEGAQRPFASARPDRERTAVPGTVTTELAEPTISSG